MEERVKFRMEKGVAWVTLNRPESLNAIDIESARQLYETLRRCARDTGVRVVVLHGEGRAFCAGGDVKAMHMAADKSLFLRDLTKGIHRAVMEIRGMDKPVIAAVHGAAAGAGLAIALGCDLILAEERTRFNTAFLNIGAAPGCGVYFLTNMVGEKKAKELLLLNKTLSAKEAADWGIVNRVVPIGEIQAEAGKMALDLACGPALALGRAKQLVNRSIENSLEAQLEMESQALASSGDTLDFEEGVKAFAEKRKPQFQGM